MTKTDLKKAKELDDKINCLNKLIEVIEDYDGGVPGMSINHKGHMLIIMFPPTMLPGIKCLAEIEKSYLEKELEDL